MAKKTEVVFFGTPEFSQAVLRELLTIPEINIKCVVTQPDREAGRKLELKSSPVKIEAVKHNLPVLQPNSLRKQEEMVLRTLGAFDVGIVVAYGQIITEKILDLAEFGFINIHASLLPRWRGAAPIQRAILAKDRQTGVGLMKMTPRLDDGPVYIEEQLELSNLTYGQAHDRLVVLGSKLIKDNLLKIIRGEISPVEQKEEGITYAHKIANEESRINWENSGEDIINLIRAFNPIPSAFTLIDDLRLKIFDAKLTNNKSSLPGRFIINKNHNLEVETGSNNIELLDVQLSGKTRQSCDSLLNGFKPKGNILL